MSAMGQPHPADSAVEKARERALQLAQQRKQVDLHLQQHAEILKREGVTLTSSLLDSQGFPLNSVDIPTVREARSKIIALQNDRKEIDKELASLVDVALAKGTGSTQTTSDELLCQLSPYQRLKLDSDRFSASNAIDTGHERSSSLTLAKSESDDKSASARGLFLSLSLLDRLLPLWIFLAVVIGILIGQFAPNVQSTFATEGGELQGVATPLVVGLVVMMWPILTKVQYERAGELFSSRRIWTQIGVSLVLNWIVAPFLMLALAWATLPDLPTYRSGIILVGIARCIAMVNIWVGLAKGECDVCALVVIVNALLQIALFSPYSLLLLNVIAASDTLKIDYPHTATAVALYLGVPLAAGILTRATLIFALGKQTFQAKFIPYFSAFSLLSLLYVVVVIFALQAKHVLQNLGPTFRCFVPLTLYFTLIWVGTFFGCWRLSRKYSRTFDYQLTVVQAFTASSNNFELAIAVTVSAYGAGSDQALAASIGAFIEIPVLLTLTYVSLWLGRLLEWGDLPLAKSKEIRSNGMAEV